MKKVPQLKRKNRRVDPDSLAAALNWDKLADPSRLADELSEDAKPVVVDVIPKSKEKDDGTTA